MTPRPRLRVSVDRGVGTDSSGWADFGWKYASIRGDSGDEA